MINDESKPQCYQKCVFYSEEKIELCLLEYHNIITYDQYSLAMDREPCKCYRTVEWLKERLNE